MMAAQPSAPVPKMAMVESGVGFATLKMVPAPVERPQPSGPRSSNGASLRTLTTLLWLASAWVAKEDCAKKAAPMGAPELSVMVGVPSARRVPKLSGA